MIIALSGYARVAAEAPESRRKLRDSGLVLTTLTTNRSVAGIVRETEQRGDQGREPLRERPAEEHDATRAGEHVQLVRQDHHVADTLRQHHR